jgi:hypothetical protein
MGAPLRLFLTGKVMGGRYRLTADQGNTFQGVLHAAVDERTNEPVAAVVFFTGTLTDTPEREKLLAFSHPRVTRLIAAGVDEGHVWFAREPLPERFLLDELAAHRLSLGRALAIVEAVCEGVAALHDAGLVHGGVAPFTVFVGYPKSPRDTDVADVKLVDPLLPGATPERPPRSKDVEDCVALLVRLIEEREVPEAVAALRKQTFSSARELGAACATCLAALTPEERDAITPRPPPAPMPVGMPMPTNWSPPPPRPPFEYTAAVIRAPDLMPTNWSPPPPTSRRTSPRGPIAVAVSVAAAAAAAIGWWLLR